MMIDPEKLTLHRWLTHSGYRACSHCVWGGLGNERVCTYSHVVQTTNKPIKVELARASGGACGPEAQYLHIASWGPIAHAMSAEGLSPSPAPVKIERRRYMLDQKSLASGEKPEPDSDFNL